MSMPIDLPLQTSEPTNSPTYLTPIVHLIYSSITESTKIWVQTPCIIISTNKVKPSVFQTKNIVIYDCQFRFRVPNSELGVREMKRMVQINMQHFEDFAGWKCELFPLASFVTNTHVRAQTRTPNTHTHTHTHSLHTHCKHTCIRRRTPHNHSVF